MSQTIVSSPFHWQKWTKPIIGLAPMDGVTDYAYRTIQKKYGQPDVMFTEFVNVEGLCHGAKRLMHHFVYNLNSSLVNELLNQLSQFDWPKDHLTAANDLPAISERPIMAQLYGKTPKCFYQAALLVAYMGFDGIDINMGCPAKNVASHGAGAGLIQTPKLAQAIIQAVKQAVIDWRAGATLNQAPDISGEIKLMAKKIAQLAGVTPNQTARERKLLPVSVKTRIGYDQPITKVWISHLLANKIDALSVHGRTLKQAYRGQANWDEIGQAAQLAQKAKVVFLGNGDIDNWETAQTKIKQYELDGVLIGRASFGNPFVFRPKNRNNKVTQIDFFHIAQEHAHLYEKMIHINLALFDSLSPTATQRAQIKNLTQLFLPMRKHLAWYVKNIPHAKQLRSQLMQADSAQMVEKILKSIG